MTPALHIGILTYNGLSHTKRCLDSLRAHTSAPWRMVIRDNASSDDTPDYLTALHDERIRVHCATENLGVGGGRNWLLTTILAQAAPHDLIVLLDNDIEVADGWDLPFIEAFARQPKLGLAGRWAFSLRVHATWRDVFNENAASSSPVDTVQGCVFWLRVEAARQVGLFDESLGRFWHEDDDYSVRVLSAGWEVQRVAGGGIVHHEHGSGVALHPDKVIGSANNQAKLVNKWRDLGMVSEQGFIRRTQPDEHEALRAALSGRLGRLIVRSELNSALADMAVLMHGTLSDAEVAVRSTPLVQLLLRDVANVANVANVATAVPAEASHESQNDEGAAIIATRTLAHMARILHERRRSAPARQPAASDNPNTRSLNAVCTPHTWDQAHWSTALRDLMHDGTGVDYYARSESTWRDGQLVQALHATGVGSKSAVLVVGRPGERIITALSCMAGVVVVADTESSTRDQMQGFAMRPLGGAMISSVTWPMEATTLFDAVVCPNAGVYTAPEGYRQLLSRLAQFAKRGALVSVAASVRISGPSSANWLEISTLADDAALRSASLRRIGTMNLHVCDEVLLAAAPADAPTTWRPRLSRSRINNVATMATVAARKL